MTVIDTQQIKMPSDPILVKKIKDALQEASNSYVRQDGEKDFLKELFTDLAKETELPKGFLVRAAKMYHKQNAAAVSADSESVVELYETVFGPIGE